jgi:hypothetical protein
VPVQTATGPSLRDDLAMRVVSWNVAFRDAAAAQRQGICFVSLVPTCCLLQEVNPNSAEVLRSAAGADWLVRAVDHRIPGPDDRPCSAPRGRDRRFRPGFRPRMAARGRPVARAHSADRGMRGWHQPDRCLLPRPPGVSWGLVKPRQAVALRPDSQLTPVRWCSEPMPILHSSTRLTSPIPGPTGTQAAGTCTASRAMICCSGQMHPLDDALRRWLADRPGGAERLAASAPLRPGHHPPTGRRKDSSGAGRRFDCIWIPRHWTVQRIDHLYDAGIAAGSDHAVVVADLAIALESDSK